ncbi:DNA-binding IclR family transcriptional regulator [Neorhizobium sp. 2083]|uniref:IclR family transcriptional regulator n=1 Tax=Neorhizobium sp. 2083 TaxID=2817762 RepID=UPI0013AF7C9F|nr:IclR family transcriptional regulator [Neorhizobium sp. 2083]MDR6817594.1 DNA-binding IclR family transcriptional regulator [Neorhizobium sp. 2083]
MPRIEGKSGDGVQAVQLALNIIEHVAKERHAVGVTALAQALGTTKSRIHRHLQTLVQQGYLIQPRDSDRYESGPRLVALGRAVSDNLDLAHVAADPLLELRDALGHSAVVSQITPDGMRVVHMVPGRSPIEIGVRVGSLLTFNSSAQGKAALAFVSPEFRSRVLRGKLEIFTPHTIISPAVLLAELETVRAQGWATAPNQAGIGLNTLAAPVFDSSGVVCGAVGIVDMVQFIAEVPSEDQRARTMAAAKRVSSALGYGAL